MNAILECVCSKIKTINMFSEEKYLNSMKKTQFAHDHCIFLKQEQAVKQEQTVQPLLSP